MKQLVLVTVDKVMKSLFVSNLLKKNDFIKVALRYAMCLEQKLRGNQQGLLRIRGCGQQGGAAERISSPP